MKKVLTAFLVLALMLGVVAVTAGAAGTGSASLSAGTTEVQPGDTFTVKFNITGNPGIFGLTYTPSYDTSRLKLLKMEGADGNWTCTQNAVWMNSALEDSTFTGSVVTLTFQVVDGAAVGTASIGGSVEAGNYNEEVIPFSLSSCSVTIKAAPHTHDWGTGTVTTEPTCEGKGVRTYTCSICHETKTEELAALGHQWDNGKVTAEATCEGKGVKTYTCTVCQATRTEEIPSLGGHKWDGGKVTAEPTCEGKGVKTYTCTVCQATRTEEIAPLGHKWDSGKVTTEPTCEGKGVRTFTCTVCKGTKTEDIAPEGHSYKWVVTREATCTDPGKREETCTVCSNVRASETIPAAGHKWDAGKVTTEPTCEEKGVRTFTCTVCKDTKTEDIAPLGHTWGNWEAVTGEDIHSRQCTACQKTEKEAHKWDSGRQTKPATCSADGEKTFSCEICKAIKTEPIPATGVHDYTDHYSFVDGEDVHYGYCVCGAKGPAEKHQYTQEGDVLVKPTTTKEGSQEKLCVCGAKTTVTLEKLKSGEYDNVPKTGDITGMVVLLVTVSLAAIGGALYLIKRKLTY